MFGDLHQGMRLLTCERPSVSFFYTHVIFMLSFTIFLKFRLSIYFEKILLISTKDKCTIQYWVDQNDHLFLFDIQRKSMCAPWTLYVTGYPHNSPSIAVIRGEHDPSSPDRESVSSSKRRLLINISSDDDSLAGNATVIPNAGIGSRWCTRNLQTLVLPCTRASVCTRTRAHNTRFISRARRAEMREKERGEERMRERIRATRSLVNVPCRTVSYRIYPRSLSTEKMLRYLPDPIQERHRTREISRVSSIN